MNIYFLAQNSRIMGKSKKRSHSRDRNGKNKTENVQKIAKKIHDLEARLERVLRQQKEDSANKVSSRKKLVSWQWIFVHGQC